MPGFAPTPVDIGRLLYTAQARRQRLRGRCPGDRFRAAMAILKLEKERMQGKWSFDCLLDIWAEANDLEPVVESVPAGAAGSFPPPLAEGRREDGASPGRRPPSDTRAPVARPTAPRRPPTRSSTA